MNNSYIIKYKDEELKAHPLRADEVDRVFDFLQQVSFTRENYKSLLGLEGESIFRKKGALVETTKELLIDAVEHPELYLSIGIWNPEGEPEAFIICEAEDNENMLSSKNDFIFKEGFEDTWDTWIKLKEEHAISYKGDMAVNTKSRFRKLYFIMYYLLAAEMKERDFKIGVSEVFYITEFFDGAVWHDINIYNERSFKAQIRGTKAKYVADGMLKVRKWVKRT